MEKKQIPGMGGSVLNGQQRRIENGGIGGIGGICEF